MERGRRSVVLARRRDEIVLHAGIVLGRFVEALSQPRQRQIRGRDREGGPRRCDQQVARCGGVRLRQRRMAGPVRGQRHAAEQAVPQQPQRHVHRGGRTVGRGLQRGWRGARRDGRRRRRLRPQRACAPAGGQLLQPDAGVVPQRGQRAVRGRSAALGGGPREPALADVRLLLLRLRPGRLAGHLRRERCYSATRAAGGSRMFRRRWARISRGPWWRAARPTRISTATATSTSS